MIYFDWNIPWDVQLNFANKNEFLARFKLFNFLRSNVFSLAVIYLFISQYLLCLSNVEVKYECLRVLWIFAQFIISFEMFFFIYFVIIIANSAFYKMMGLISCVFRFSVGFRYYQNTRKYGKIRYGIVSHPLLQMRA